MPYEWSVSISITRAIFIFPKIEVHSFHFYGETVLDLFLKKKDDEGSKLNE